VIRAAVSTESYVLAVLAMVSAVIAAYLYLRIMVSMWLSVPASSEAISALAPKLSLPLRVTLVSAVAITLVLGVLPTWLLDVSDSLALFAR